MHLHASVAHTFSLPSSQPVTMLLLSGLLHTAVTPPLCPSSVAVQHALGCDSCCRSHTLAVESPLPEITNRPSLVQHTAQTGKVLLWPSSRAAAPP